MADDKLDQSPANPALKESNTAAMGSMPRNFHPSKRGLISLFVTILIIAVFGSVYLYRHHHSNLTTSVYKYHKLDSAKLSGSVAGSGIAFQKPAELTILKSSETLSHETFVHGLKVGGQGTSLAWLYVSSRPTSKPLSDAALKDAGATLDPTSLFYKNAMAGLRSQTRQLFPSYIVNLSQPTAITTSYLKADAWQFELSLVDSKKVLITTLKGKLTYIISKKANYYFLIVAADHNWQPNSAVWQQVFNSLKVDQ